jgi:hypothetical protein
LDGHCKALIVVVVLTLFAFVEPTRATTFDTGVPSLVAAPGPLGPCAFLQVGTINQWFVVPTSDANYDDEVRLLRLAQIRQQSITFTDAGTTVSNCQGYELATDIRLGTPPCFNATGLDFTIQCNAIESVLGVF